MKLIDKKVIFFGIGLLIIIVAMALVKSIGWNSFERKDTDARVINSPDLESVDIQHTTCVSSSNSAHTVDLRSSNSWLEERSKAEIIRRAIEEVRWRETMDTNATPTVKTEGGEYVVTFWKYENPFRAGEREYDSRVAIDVLTGEVANTELGQGGVGMHMLDPKSSGGTKAEKERNLLRVREAGVELNRRVKVGLPLSDDIAHEVPNILSVAVQHAKARGRKYDELQDPMLLRIGKVFIVVLWPPTESVREGGAAYDSKVFLDADNQSVLGMEVTRQLLHEN